MSGFSAVLGNPPFLGGSKISTHSSVETANFIRQKFEGGAKADLISYFVRQSFDFLEAEGIFGLVSTNALRSGESRLCGLFPILKKEQSSESGLSRIQCYQAYISDALKSIEWTGDAAVTVDLLTIKKTNLKANVKHPVAILDGKKVSSRISSRLNLRADSDPLKLDFNQDISQRGVNPRGKFQIPREQHDLFVTTNPACKKVLKPWVSGDDINKNGSASKYIIDLNGFDEEEVRKYPQVCDYVEQHIKSYRDDLKDAKEYERLKERWWEWEFTAPSITNWFENHATVYAKSRHSTRWIISEIPRGSILSEGTFSFFFDQLEYFVVLQSVLHEDWAREFGSTLGNEGHRYTNSCILNFPFPTESTEQSRIHAREVGRKYLDLRKEICETRDCSISELQDFMHDPKIEDKDILDYRCATIELDDAALRLYGIESHELIRSFQQSSTRTKFWPPQNLVESLFSLLLEENNRQALNIDKVESNQESMGVKDVITKFRNRNMVATEPSARVLSETKGVEVTLTQTEEVVNENSDDSDNKRFIIYGHRKSSDISGSPVNMNQIKVGSVGRAPTTSLPRWFSIDDIGHSEKGTEKFNVTLQRLNDSGAIFGGTGSAVQRDTFKEHSSDMLPIIIDLKEEFPDIDWNDESKHEHSLVTVEKSWIHQNMRDRRVNPEKPNDEWFFIDEDEDPREFILNLIRRQLNRPPGKEYLKSERPHQYWARNRIQDLAESQSENENHQWDLMLELAPRFGKTSFILGYWTYNTDFPLLIIAAHVLSAHTSFTKAVQKWDTGAGTEVIHLRDEGAAEKIKSTIDSGKRVVLLASQHLANKESEESEDSTSEGSSEVDTSLIDEVFEVTKQYDAVIYVDEADHGSHTLRSQMVIEAAVSTSEKQRHVLHGTGTNIERASSFDRENIGLVRVTYTDILEAKKGEGFLFDESIDGLIGRDILNSEKVALDTIRDDIESWRERLEHIVEPIYLRLSLPDELVTQFETNFNSNPDWTNVYKNHTNLQTKNWVKSFFDHLLNDTYSGGGFSLSNILEEIPESDGTTALNPLDSDEPVGIMVWCGQEKKHVEMMKKAAEQALGSDWICHSITGDYTTNANAEDVAKSMVRTAKVTKKSKGVIFFSSGMGSRSFSVPEISIVIDCYDGGGMYTAHQKHSRALTPNPASSKQHGFIINMAIDPNRTVSHYEDKIIHDTIHSKNATEGDIKEQLAQKIRMHSLFRWSEQEGSSPVLIEAAELERLALDAPRIVDMLMYDSQNLASEFDDGEETLSLLQCLAEANSDLALTKTIQRLLSKQRSGGDSSGGDDEEVADDEEEAEEPEIEPEVVEDEETLSSNDIRKLLNQLVIIVQNIGLQVTDDEADHLGDALDILEAEELEDALKYWTGGIGIEDFKTLTDKLGPKVIDSAFRISRSSDQFDWIEEWRDEDGDS